MSLALLTFSLFSTLALVLKDLLLTYDGTVDVTAIEKGSNENNVVDFSALFALLGDAGGSKEKVDSVVVAIGGADTESW